MYLLVVRCGVRWCFGVWVLFTNTVYVRGWVCFVGWFSYSGTRFCIFGGWGCPVIGTRIYFRGLDVVPLKRGHGCPGIMWRVSPLLEVAGGGISGIKKGPRVMRALPSR